MDSFLFGMGVVFAIVAILVLLIGILEKPKAAPALVHHGKALVNHGRDWNAIFVATGFFVILSAAFFAIDAYLKRPPRVASPSAPVQAAESPTPIQTEKPKAHYNPTAEERSKLDAACDAAKASVDATLIVSGFGRDIAVSHKCGFTGSGAPYVDVTVRLQTSGAKDLYASGKLRKETYPIIQGLYLTILREKGFEKPRIEVMTDFKNLF